MLRYSYEFTQEQVVDALERLLGQSNIVVRDAACLKLAITGAHSGLDVADALHLVQTPSRGRFLTFDQVLARQAGKAVGIRSGSP